MGILQIFVAHLRRGCSCCCVGSRRQPHSSCWDPTRAADRPTGIHIWMDVRLGRRDEGSRRGPERRHRGWTGRCSRILLFGHPVGPLIALEACNPVRCHDKRVRSCAGCGQHDPGVPRLASKDGVSATIENGRAAQRTLGHFSAHYVVEEAPQHDMHGGKQHIAHTSHDAPRTDAGAQQSEPGPRWLGGEGEHPDQSQQQRQ